MFKRVSLLTLFTVLTFSVTAQQFPATASSTDETWATANRYIAVNYQVNFQQKRMHTIAEATATFDLGNGKVTVAKYTSLSDFLEDASRHGMNPISFVPKSNDTVTIVFENSAARR